MQYKHTDFDNSVNSPKVSAFRELLAYLAGFAVFILITYLILGFVAEAMVTRISEKTEREIGNVLFKSEVSSTGDPAKAKYLQELLDSIPKDGLPDYGGYKIYLIKDEEPNAFAAVGGYIFVTDGMLKLLDSENSLVFVLGHELGHFKNRDQLRGLGRSLVWVFIQGMLLGENMDMAANTAGTYELALSRGQEEAADETGLKLLAAKYGHVGGATGFFDKRKGDEANIKLLEYFSTHPYSAERIKRLNAIIKKQGYKVEATKKLPI